jgi:glycosyltransferase involved in cell wall biosynthesis
VLPHEDNLLTILIHKPMTKLVLSLSTHILALSESELKIAKLLLPEKSSDYILENSFGSVMRGKKISKTRARKELKLPNKPVILFFGAVRPYKGLEDLISAFGLLRKNGIDAALLVAGAFWDSPEKYVSIARTLGIEKEIKIINKYIPDEEIPRLFCASDIVVLPHRTATQSAIPLLAFLYNVPIIATSVGGNSVFVDDKKTGFLVPPKDTQKLAFAMKEFFEKKLSNPFKKQMRLKGKMFEWNEKKEKIFFGEND